MFGRNKHVYTCPDVIHQRGITAKSRHLNYLVILIAVSIASVANFLSRETPAPVTTEETPNQY